MKFYEINIGAFVSADKMQTDYTCTVLVVGSVDVVEYQ